MFNKKNKLFLFLSGVFISNALLAEFIGGKIFSLESTFGFEPLQVSMFGVMDLSLDLSAGVLLWPVVFVFTDVINEYFGEEGVRFLSWMTAGLIGFCFIMLWFSMQLAPSAFWEFKELENGGKLHMPSAFNAVFGQGMWIIAGSLTAFLVSQLVDVKVFQLIKRLTGNKMIWLRATGSTIVSQLIDSFIVLFIAFYLSGVFTLSQVFAIGLMGYMYKFLVAVCLTPILYVIHGVIDRYLGHELSREMMDNALSPHEKNQE